MSRPIPLSDEEFIDVSPPKRLRWKRWLIAAIVLVLIALSRSLAIYISALWFDSLGFQEVYWYILKLKVALFLLFGLLTVLILRSAFWLLEKLFSLQGLPTRTIILNNQTFQFAPGKLLRPLGWVIALLFGLFYAVDMNSGWQAFALYFHQPATDRPDPIFNKPLGFYLFSLPVYDAVSSWLLTLAVVLLVAAIAYALLTLPEKVLKAANRTVSGTAFAAVSVALAALLLSLAWRTYLSRFPYLWDDHQTFSGVSYTEANYLLPALFFVAIALVVAAVLTLINAFTKRSIVLLLIGVALPLLVYIVGGVIVPTYVQSFIVKPNELGRETPYIQHNIVATRHAFSLRPDRAA